MPASAAPGVKTEAGRQQDTPVPLSALRSAATELNLHPKTLTANKTPGSHSQLRRGAQSCADLLSPTARTILAGGSTRPFLGAARSSQSQEAAQPAPGRAQQSVKPVTRSASHSVFSSEILPQCPSVAARRAMLLNQNTQEKPSQG
eukprot:CAMPEP_0177652710 /NCGR_PEP_ID=MMETSP0447-20121125/13287_1 /TAXON_ID=0 /ORGANISM="Stygamoeba regulata, Strain BSH-02190019" /LENGTH=145 /DNA_ID=CAMNT_0019155997 /DNA_START=1 /DNA_END=438 /DNA_ORIENTATION=+